ncbi:TPA: hypothetical protein ACGO3Z_001918 [Streptococcus suis]
MPSSQKIASVVEINQFLMEFKKSLSMNGIEFVPRTYDGITSLGLDIELAKMELYDLTFHDYDRGATKDYNGDGTDIWEFGKNIDEELVYIKIKLDSLGKCKVLSFKKSNGPWTLPYKE